MRTTTLFLVSACIALSIARHVAAADAVSASGASEGQARAESQVDLERRVAALEAQVKQLMVAMEDCNVCSAAKPHVSHLQRHLYENALVVLRKVRRQVQPSLLQSVHQALLGFFAQLADDVSRDAHNADAVAEPLPLPSTLISVLNELRWHASASPLAVANGGALSVLLDVVDKSAELSDGEEAAEISLAVFQLVIAASAEARSDFLKRGGLPAVVKAVQSSPESVLLAEAATRLLVEFGGSEADQANVVAAGGLEATVRALARFPGDADLVALGGALLHTLLYFEKTAGERAGRALEAGAVPALVEALRANPASLEAEGHALLLLEVLARRMPAAVGEAVSAGMLPPLLRSLRTHGDQPEIAFSALMLLSHASDDSLTARAVAASEAPHAVVAAMAAHGGDGFSEEEVQEAGLKALLALANNGYAEQVLEAGGADAVVGSMRLHPKVPDVVKYAMSIAAALCEASGEGKEAVCVAGVNSVLEASRVNCKREDVAEAVKRVGEVCVCSV